MVVLNSMYDKSATFGFDNNKITIITSDFIQKEFPLKNKNKVAKDIVDSVFQLSLKRRKYQRVMGAK